MLYHKKVAFTKKVSHIIEVIFLLIFTGIMNLFPYRSLHSVARAIVFLFHPLLKSSRRRIKENLAFAYPNLKGSELKSFITRNLTHNIRVFLEVMQMRKFRKKSFLKKYITFDEQTLTDVRNREGAIVIVEGHFGNWELGIPFYVHNGEYPYFSAKHLSNPYSDRLLHRRRTRYGGQIFYIEESQGLIRQAKKNSLIGLVADQDAGGDGVFINFFGREASTFKGPAVLSLLSSARFFLLTFVFEGRGRYRASGRILADKIDRKKYKSMDEAIEAVSRLWVNALEQEVRKNPEQYFWIHRRWKTRPPEEKK